MLGKLLCFRPKKRVPKVAVHSAKVIARKASGVFIEGLDGRLLCMPKKSKDAELCAGYEGARFVREKILTDPELDYSGGIYFQLDNASAVEKMQNCFFQRPVKDGDVYHKDPNYHAMIVDTKEIMDQGLQRANSKAPYSICHVDRDYNKVADALASYAQNPHCGMVPNKDFISANNEKDFNEYEIPRDVIDRIYGDGESGVHSVREPWNAFNSEVPQVPKKSTTRKSQSKRA